MILFIVLISINSVNALEDNATTQETMNLEKNKPLGNDISSDLESKINNAENGDLILIELMEHITLTM